MGRKLRIFYDFLYFCLKNIFIPKMTGLQKLTQLIQKDEHLILGLMSGTSLDGLDIALCRIKGREKNTQVTLEHFTTYPYTEALQRKIREVFAQEVVKLSSVCMLNSRIASLHARMVLETLKTWHIQPEDVDCIASHGQTIYHAPKRLHMKPHYDNSTLQIGDGDHLAHRTGIITISDFRQKHVAAGGEGAPLVVYGDYILFSESTENRILLNIGGIANFTYLPASENPQDVRATDTGPGNTLIDTAVRTYLPPMLFDDEGAVAKAGKVDTELLKTLKLHPFFLQSFPKTTGQELFNMKFFQDAQRNSNTLDLHTADLVATLTRFTAETIAESIKEYAPNWQNCTVYLSGGGSKNLTLVEHLNELLAPCKFGELRGLGFPPHAKEASLFALLAHQTLTGTVLKLGEADYIPAVSLGKISLPD